MASAPTHVSKQQLFADVLQLSKQCKALASIVQALMRERPAAPDPVVFTLDHLKSMAPEALEVIGDNDAITVRLKDAPTPH